MKTLYSSLLCVLLTAVSYAQKETEQDTLNKKTTKLNEVIVTGNKKTDPVLTIVSNKYAENIVQPKNVADLFNNIEHGF